MNKEAIQSIVNSKGWEYIRQMFHDEITSKTSVENINGELPDRVIARQVEGMKLAKEIVEKVLKDLDRIASNEPPVPKKSYK